MTINNLVARLKNVLWIDENSYRANCPSHPDRNLSLSITKTEKGLLLKCRAGCDCNQVLCAVGLDENSFDSGFCAVSAEHDPLPFPNDKIREMERSELRVDRSCGESAAVKRKSARCSLDLLTLARKRIWKVVADMKLLLTGRGSHG